jgi:hypothetical protein
MNGKIYRILDNTTGAFYIGSTIKDLKERLRGHETSARASAEGYGLASKEIIQNGDYCIEQYYMGLYPRCINKNRACLLPEVKREIDKQRYIQNKDVLLEKKRIYDQTYIHCPCGSGYSMSHRARHLRTEKCKSFHINNNIESCIECPPCSS